VEDIMPIIFLPDIETELRLNPDIIVISNQKLTPAQIAAATALARDFQRLFRPASLSALTITEGPEGNDTDEHPPLSFLSSIASNEKKFLLLEINPEACPAYLVCSNLSIEDYNQKANHPIFRQLVKQLAPVGLHYAVK
jgi:hypothetical protein